MKNSIVNIAIDGPSGAGKSTISQKIATDMGYIYVDTGALYRTVGFSVWKNNISLNNSDHIASHVQEIKISLGYVMGSQRVFLNGEDVSDFIRTPEISMYASAVSAIGDVRKALFHLQRDIASCNNVIMDGRDIGTVVLPNALIKIFLTATVEDRANRRFLELKRKGISTSFEEVLKDMKIRDENDSKRDVAPLKPAEDALIIDTTGFTFEDSVKKISKIIKEKLDNVL
jgi:cytidylate kinase